MRTLDDDVDLQRWEDDGGRVVSDADDPTPTEKQSTPETRKSYWVIVEAHEIRAALIAAVMTTAASVLPPIGLILIMGLFATGCSLLLLMRK